MYFCYSLFYIFNAVYFSSLILLLLTRYGGMLTTVKYQMTRNNNQRKDVIHKHIGLLLLRYCDGGNWL